MALLQSSRRLRTTLRVMAIVLACSAAGVESCNEYSTESRSALNFNDDIREAAFRYLFEHNASAQQQTVWVYFLSVTNLPDSLGGAWIDADPSEELIARFRNNTPRVRPCSQATTSLWGVFDVKSGIKGLLFRLGEIRWITKDRVEIDGGYYEAGLSASGGTYILERKNGIWSVVGGGIRWIS